MDDNFIQFFRDLRTKNLLYDAVLGLEDGGIFQAHRLILSWCSEYFMTLFTTQLHCTQRTDVTLSGATSETMSLILDYAYRRSVDINQENVRALLVSADYLCMPGLLELCCEFLKSMLSPENCIGIMRFARDYSSSLEEDACCFLLRNFGKVSQQSDELLELPPEELEAIIGADELNVKNEKVVWDGVLRWINHDKENRKGKIVELIKKVRLELLDPEFLLENVKDHPYVAENDECFAIVMDTLNSMLDSEMITEKEGEIPDRESTLQRIQHETLFIIAECIGLSDMGYILTYNTRTNRWIVVEQILEREEYATAVTEFDIYVIGGSYEEVCFNSCLRFNVVAQRWFDVSSMYERRFRLIVAVLDGLVYAMGGSDDLSIHNTVERYDYRTDRWSMLAPMKDKRMYASATTLNGKIYVVGGFNDFYGYLNSAEVYDPVANQWTSIADMMSARSAFSCIAYHDYVYAMGGRITGESSLCSVEKYNPTTNEWTQIPDMLQPRMNFGIAVLDDRIFALGGAEDMKFVEYYEEKSNEWIAARHPNICAVKISACVIMYLPNVCHFIKYYKDGSLKGEVAEVFDFEIYMQSV
jgi:kelch-like protein 10